MINNNYPQIKNTDKIESILCLTVLIANNTLPYNSTIQDSERYYQDINKNQLYDDCTNCQYKNNCLACIINE